jgi:hypothetical protein
MTRVILILLTLVISVQLLPAQSKRKKPALDLDFDKVTGDACGVRKSIGQAIDEADLEWRSAGPGIDAAYFYNTRKMDCNRKSKTLRVWVKEIRNGNTRTASMARYELNCRTEQIRILSMVSYYENGKVSDVFDPTNPKWQDVTPETIGSAILVTVCRKSL